MKLIGIGPSGQQALDFMRTWGFEHPALQHCALPLNATISPKLTRTAGLVLVVGDLGTHAELKQAQAVAAKARKDGALVVAVAMQPAGQDLSLHHRELSGRVDALLPMPRQDFSVTDHAGLPLDLPLAIAAMMLAYPFCSDVDPESLNPENMVELLENSGQAALAMSYGGSVVEAAEAAWKQLEAEAHGASGAVIQVAAATFPPTTEMVAAIHGFIERTPLAELNPWGTFGRLPHRQGGNAHVAILLAGKGFPITIRLHRHLQLVINR